MPASAYDVEPLLVQVSRMSRLLHRLKGSTPGGSYDRSANVLLLVIDRVGPLRIADLATTCHVDASTVSRQAAELVREGLVHRQADPQDGRASLMALTTAGAKHVAYIKQRRREFFEQVVSGWEPQTVDVFLALLTRFVDDIEQRVERSAEPSTVGADA
ncbi:MAG: MarR family transcriptional regulator [Nocardioidaceae bacterium]|nr:MarR family transcriptional regulator [Nocardioidaceae bacterium]